MYSSIILFSGDHYDILTVCYLFYTKLLYNFCDYNIEHVYSRDPVSINLLSSHIVGLAIYYLGLCSV